MVASLSMQSTVKFHDGNEIPILGFGTYEMEGDQAYNAVIWALEAGYRHIDSAAWYENEKEVGQAIRDFCASSGTPRAAIFFTTKLQLNNGYAGVRKAIDRSLAECGLGYIDLYLIHGPIGGPEMRRESWRACCDAKKEGKLRSIGISTFGVGHMKELLQPGVEVPVCTQIDLHPFMTRNDVVSFCKEHKMALEAWAPLVRGMRFDHPSIVSLAEKYKKSAAQVLLRWSLQKGFIPIPKSASKERIISNAELFDFELSADEMAHLDSLDECKEPLTIKTTIDMDEALQTLVTDWDPTNDP